MASHPDARLGGGGAIHSAKRISAMAVLTINVVRHQRRLGRTGVGFRINFSTVALTTVVALKSQPAI
jgi:hypothetical protein